MQQAYEDNFEKAIIISGDSDLIPSINQVKSLYPNKLIGVVVPFGRSAVDIKNACDFHRKMKRINIESSLLPAKVQIGCNTVHCPPEWT